MAKKLSVLAIVGFAAFSVVLSCGGLLGHSLLFAQASNEALVDHIATLDSTNSPTTSTTYVDSVTHGSVFEEYTYTHVKAGTNMHCVLDVNGTITKDREALGLKYVNVTFTGSLVLETKFDASGAVTTYELTSGEQTTLCGNYVSFKALSETSIEQITLVYTCTHSHANAHDVVETSETVLNGTDLDKVWKCSQCDYTETRMDPNGFNTYRNGEFIMAKSDTISLETVETDVGGVTGATRIVGGAANNWNNKVEPSLITEKDRAYATNIKKYDVNYITFDFYLGSGANFRLYGPSSVQNGSKGFIVNTGTKLPYGNNNDILIFDGNKPVVELTANKWYTASVSYAHFDRENWDYTNVFACTEIVVPVGDIYLNNLRYWHEDAFEVNPGFVWGSAYNGTTPLAHTGTLTTETNDIGGRTNVSKYTGTNTYKDQLDIEFTTSYGSPAGTGNGANAWYYVWSYARHQRINKVTFDVYVPTGSSVRLQTRPSTAQITHLLAAGQAYTGFNSGTFSSTGIVITYGEGTVLNQNDIVPADTWLTVTYDISYWMTNNFNGAGYCNLSLTAPSGTVYFDNVNYVRLALQ